MSQTTLLTREPVVNKNRAITANRLIAHGPNIASVVEALAAQADVWPTHHPVFVSLGRLVPTPELLDWAIPENVAIEIPVQTLAHPHTQALIARLREAVRAGDHVVFMSNGGFDGAPRRFLAALRDA